jgi:hypothetical protein
MANDISKRNETLPSTAETNSYLAYANSVASSRIVGKLLKFTKFGEFLAGEEGEEVPMGTELIVHGEEMYVGWQKWEDNRPVDHIMGRLCDGFEPPKRSELDDLDKATWEVDDNNQPRDPWQNSAYTIMYDPKANQIYTFATSSKGGHKANGAIAKVYYQHARMTPDMFPVISLNWTEYDHSNPRYGKIRNPVFTVIGWTGRGKIDEALQAAVGEATAQAEADQSALDYYEEKPAPKPVSKPAPKQAESKLDRQPERQPERQPQTLSSAARKPRF